MNHQIHNIINKINIALSSEQTKIKIRLSSKILRMLQVMKSEGLIEMELVKKDLVISINRHKATRNPLMRKIKLLGKPGRSVPVK